MLFGGRSMGTNCTLGLSLLLLLVAHVSCDEWETEEIIRQVTDPGLGTPLNLTPYVDVLPQTTKIHAYTKGNGKFWPVNLTIGMYQTTTKFHRDLPPTPVFVYGTSQANATFPGPTIEAIRNVPTYVTWDNHLPLNHILPVDYTIKAALVGPNGGVPGVVHLHGGVIAPDSDGSAFAWYTANYSRKGFAWTQKTYTYPNVQHSGNLMYHDHALGFTRVNLLAGLLGGYVIRDPVLDAMLNLPSGNQYDRHLIIADRNFSSDGKIYMNPVGDNPSIHPVWNPEYFGDVITVNGKIWPYLRVNRRKYRFRIINTSNARYFNLSFSAGNIPFTVIGSDSSYLPAPVTTNSILLSIAETFDVVVDFTNASVNQTELINTAQYPFPVGTVPGPRDSKVMKFIIFAGKYPDTSTIPASLVTYQPALIKDATVKRYIAFYEYISNVTNQSTHLLINGKNLSDPATETPKSGSTELWYVINLTGDNHPLHIHLAHFQALESQPLNVTTQFTTCMQTFGDAVKCNVSSLFIGSVAPTPAFEKTWKNVVKIAPSHMATVLVKFNMVDTGLPYLFDATKQPGYVYHCHILDHEDNEMIRPLNLVP